MFDHLAMWTWPDSVREEDPVRMATRLRAAHIDIIVPYICSREGGDAKRRYEDRLRGIIEAAHRQELKVYACFDEVNSYEAMPVYDLRQVRQDGSSGTVLCHANPQVVEYVLDELRRVLTEFDYDGINLEDGYIFNQNTIYDPANNPGADYRTIPVCYCDHCRAHAPIEQPGWALWKRERLTELIAAEGQLIRQLKPGMPFSVAARVPYDATFYTPYQQDIPYYNGWPFCQSRDGFGADWAEWLRRGHINFACPMSYFHSRRIVELQTRESQHEIPNANTDIWIGLGLGELTVEYMATYHDTPDPALINGPEQLAALLEDQVKMGQHNCIFFSYQFLLDEHLPVLARFRKG